MSPLSFVDGTERELPRKEEKKKESQSYATLMLLIRVPTIIRSDGSFVHLCPQKGKENRVTVATFILSYKEMMVNL